MVPGLHHENPAAPGAGYNPSHTTETLIGYTVYCVQVISYY